MEKSELKLILASRSPRRAHLLAEAGYQFEVWPANESIEQEVMENEFLNFPPEQLVVQLAVLKAEEVARQCLEQTSESFIDNNSHSNQRIVILAADTVAVCKGQILGKPENRDDAKRMLQLLSGQVHDVLTGICLIEVASGKCEKRLEVTRLQMDDLSEDVLEMYLDSNRWEGKAGAFGYQDGLDWVHILEGLASNVVGLPVERLPDWLDNL